MLGCSVRTLSRAARDATGKGVRELIDERRLLEARRLLGSARWDARSVAVHLGFTDPANFGRFFRDRTGSHPGRLRGPRSWGPALDANAAEAPRHSSPINRQASVALRAHRSSTTRIDWLISTAPTPRSVPLQVPSFRC